MNIENIKALAAQLQAIGINNAAPALLRRICFQPERFVLEKRTTKGGDTVSVQCHIQKNGEGLDYLLMFYDVTLLSETTLPDEEINGVSVQVLDKQMGDIDWKTAYDFTNEKAIIIEDKATWEEEALIAKIVASLHRLEETEDGKKVADLLKQKHWLGLSSSTLFVTPLNLNGKTDMVQRFYVQETQDLISVDEACRFLQNKRLEKQLQHARRVKYLNAADNANPVISGTDGIRRRRGKAGKTKVKNKNKSEK